MYMNLSESTKAFVSTVQQDGNFPFFLLVFLVVQAFGSAIPQF